jgi:hypothetical protein
MAVPLQSPSFSDVIDSAISSRLGGVHTAMPGRVESFNKTTQRASVQPMGQQVYYDEFEARQTERYPVVLDVPVMFNGSGGNRSTFPVRAGDLVLLVFTSCSLDRVLSQGAEVDPQDDRRHCLSDAVAIPGFYAFNALPTEAPDDAYVIHAEDEVRLGGPNADEAVVVQSALDDFMDALDTAITALGVNPVAAALVALQTALNALNALSGWKAGTDKAKAE